MQPLSSNEENCVAYRVSACSSKLLFSFLEKEKDMIQQFDLFQSHNIKGFSSESNFDESVNKKIVYHYTSPKAFLSILENK